MSTLFEIKPLVWYPRTDGSVGTEYDTLDNGRYFVEEAPKVHGGWVCGYSRDKITLGNPTGLVWMDPCESLEHGKQLCEEHRKQRLLPFLVESKT